MRAPEAIIYNNPFHIYPHTIQCFLPTHNHGAIQIASLDASQIIQYSNKMPGTPMITGSCCLVSPALFFVFVFVLVPSDPVRLGRRYLRRHGAAPWSWRSMHRTPVGIATVGHHAESHSREGRDSCVPVDASVGSRPPDRAVGRGVYGLVQSGRLNQSALLAVSFASAVSA